MDLVCIYSAKEILRAAGERKAQPREPFYPTAFRVRIILLYVKRRSASSPNLQNTAANMMQHSDQPQLWRNFRKRTDRGAIFDHRIKLNLAGRVIPAHESDPAVLLGIGLRTGAR